MFYFVDFYIFERIAFFFINIKYTYFNLVPRIRI